MSRYAKGTEVSSERSRGEIERVLSRYGAEKFAYFSGAEHAAIAFVVRGRAVRMRLSLPNPQSFTKGKSRKFEAARKEWEAACRQSWRCLLLVVKAKLEAIESGIATFEDEWLAYLVLADGRTVGERVAPQLDRILSGDAPLMLGMETPKS
jgi:hypothetical protein